MDPAGQVNQSIYTSQQQAGTLVPAPTAIDQSMPFATSYYQPSTALQSAAEIGRSLLPSSSVASYSSVGPSGFNWGTDTGQSAVYAATTQQQKVTTTSGVPETHQRTTNTSYSYQSGGETLALPAAQYTTTTTTSATTVPTTALATTTQYNLGGTMGSRYHASGVQRAEQSSLSQQLSAQQLSAQQLSAQQLSAAQSTRQHITTTEGATISGAMRSVSGVTETSRVIGHETGAERLVSVVSRVDESRTYVVSEKFVEHEVKVPKKIIREELIEKIIVVPVLTEEIIEETQKIREKVVEIAKPTIVEKVVEVPETTIVEKIVEVPEVIQQEKIVHKDKIIEEERIIEIPRTVYEDKITYVDDIQYRDVPVERIVQIPEYREEVIVKEVKVRKEVPKPVPVEVPVETPVDVDRNLPVPVEAVVAYEYRMPRMKARYSKVTYPVYIPRFVEIPVPQELLTVNLISAAETYLANVSQMVRGGTTLCDMENLAANINRADLMSQIQSIDLQQAVMNAWETQYSVTQYSGYGATTTTGYGATTTTGYGGTTGGYTLSASGGYGATTGGYGATTGGYTLTQGARALQSSTGGYTSGGALTAAYSSGLYPAVGATTTTTTGATYTATGGGVTSYTTGGNLSGVNHSTSTGRELVLRA